LNSCIEEFDLSPSRTKIHRNSIVDRTTTANYGTIDPVTEPPIVIGTGDENDLLTD